MSALAFFNAQEDTAMTNVVQFPAPKQPADIPLLTAEEASAIYEQFPEEQRAAISETVRSLLAKRKENSDRIGRNEKLRGDRAEAWNRAERKLAYREAWKEIHHQIWLADRDGVLDELDCPVSLKNRHDPEKPWIFDDELRDHVWTTRRELMLTPVPTVAMLIWKRRLAKRWYSLDKEIARAIEKDQAWLEEHPARQCTANKRRTGPRK
jgi:hypothetical protein